MSANERVLRHVVIFGFTSETTGTQIDEIVRRFSALRESVPDVEHFEWGLNSSPEAVNPELTHCFVLTFHSAQARDAYLIDPAHVAFADWVGTWVEHVKVVDFWADAARSTRMPGNARRLVSYRIPRGGRLIPWMRHS